LTSAVIAESPDCPRLDALTADFVYDRLQFSQDRLTAGYSKAAPEEWAERAQGPGGG
jgi:uncharacterized protein YecE (DUF72 family)